MADSKAEALLNAARTGNLSKVQHALAAGTSIEVTDVNRMTPLLLAAQGGHFEIVRLLAGAGANLHALAFRQVDALEAAAQGGNVELVQYLLEKGLPVNGHWQPINPVFLKLGHDTPLIRAALDGNVGVVRVLLDAGADREARHHGKTALQSVRERLNDRDYVDFHSEYREIVGLLGGGTGAAVRSTDAETKEVAKFAANARRPEFKRFRKALIELCSEPRPWAPMPAHGIPAENVEAFTLRNCKTHRRLDDLQREAAGAGGRLLLSEPWESGEVAELVLFPTRNDLAVVAALGTEGANHGVSTSTIIAWLEATGADNPFRLVIGNHEMIGGAFEGKPKGAKKLAERIAEFCPAVLDEIESLGALARWLQKEKSFVLRWD